MLKDSILNHRDSLPKGSESLYSNNGDYTTWFNSFSLAKWKKYTTLKSLELELDLTGQGKLEILSDNKVIDSHKISLDETFKLTIDINKSNSILSFRLSENLKFKGGSWNIKTDGINDINCAIVICTFNRQEYLKKTLGELKLTLPENWEVIVVDNDSNPEVDLIKESGFTVLKNPNTGGAGGFTRGLMEALKKEFTHVLFMDDDIELDGRVLKKTDNFLKGLNQEYINWFLAGGMLVLDEPLKLHEHSARYNGVRVRHLNHNLNLSKFSDIKKTQKIAKYRNHYAAWWYCVVPLKEGMDLPFPFFVNGDDIEFSLRYSPGILTLNGISVWHEAFHLKYNPVKQHYLTTRNSLFINCKHNVPLITSLFNIGARYFLQRLKGKQRESDLVLMAIEDFLKGPDFLVERGNPFKMGEPCRGSWLVFIKLCLKFIASYRNNKKIVKSFPLREKLWCGINNHV